MVTVFGPLSKPSTTILHGLLQFTPPPLKFLTSIPPVKTVKKTEDTFIEPIVVIKDTPLESLYGLSFTLTSRGGVKPGSLSLQRT